MKRYVSELGLIAGLVVLIILLSLDLDLSPHPHSAAVTPESTDSPAARIRSASAVVVPQPDVRVTVADASAIMLEIDAPFRVEPVGGGKILWQARGLDLTRVSLTSKAFKFGSKELPSSGVEIIPLTSPAIWVDDHQYRGRLRLHRVEGRIRAVNVLPLEEYVAAVVDGEMPAAFPPEARKAQAIVARTFAVYQRQAVGPDSLAELTATVKSQKYLGYQYREEGRRLAGESESSRQAARETFGQICTLRGQPFCTYYCAVCGGRTMLGSEIFDDAASVLQSVDCNFCREARLYRWTAEVSRADLESDLRRFFTSRGESFGKLKTLKFAEAPRPGQLPDYEVRGDRKSIRLSGAELRQALTLRGVMSPRFAVTEKNGKFTFAGQGHGHGVGLCQWGARGLALEGKTARQIVLYYYPGASLQTLPYR